jgi:hypothetical protein
MISTGNLAALRKAAEATPEDAILRRAYSDALEEAGNATEARFQRLWADRGESGAYVVLIEEEYARLNISDHAKIDTERPSGWVFVWGEEGAASVYGSELLEKLRQISR